MAKRIYEFNYKKWGTIVGVSTATLVGLLFAYLSFLGVIEITGYSGDSVCDGTKADPCYAYINFTVKEDIFLYPVGYDPWGRNTTFLFSPGVKDWKLQRSWGSGWRNIPLDKTCTGTWCGAPNNKGVKYSYVLREGRDYKFRIVAYKNSPFEKIKWSVDYNDKEYLDPTWESQFEIPESIQDKLLYKDYQDSLREFDSLRIPNDDNTLFKSYNISTRAVSIEDDKYNNLLKLKLLTNYRQHVGVGNDIIVARMMLIDFVNSSNELFDILASYNVKDNYKEKPKIFILKYRTNWIEEMSYVKETFDNETNKSISNETIYYNQSMTNWTEFTRLDELPYKNIEIGIFTDTVLGEEIEWIPTIEGFEVLEWASYLVDNLVSYYKLDENAASTNVEDIHGTNDGIAETNTNNLYNANGRINSAFDFSGTDEWVEIADDASLDFGTGDFSVSFWINPDVDGSTMKTVGKDSYAGATPYEGFFFQRDNDKKMWFATRNTAAGQGNYHIGAVILNSGNWYHIVGVRDSNVLRLYINGDTDGTLSESSATNIDNSVTFKIGSMDEKPFDNEWNGRIDEVGIWSYALNQSAVTDLYNNGLNGISYPFEAVDTCTYSSGNWIIDCNDNCTISSDVAMGGNDLVFSNAGTFSMSANITGYRNLNLSSGCSIVLDDNTFLIN